MKKSDPKHMTENMAKATAGQMVADAGLRPKQGDQFHCDSCGLEVKVTKGCACEDANVHFHCCGQEMRPK